jgi:hypothetical protein
MSGIEWIPVILLACVALFFLGLLVWEIGEDIADRFRAEAKLKEYARQRERELLHEKIAMSNEAMRAIEEMRRRFWGTR